MASNLTKGELDVVRDIDEVSSSIGRLQGEVMGLQEAVKGLTGTVQELLQFKWKMAGVMVFLGVVVEGFHILAK